jgi:hypothetical protein
MDSNFYIGFAFLLGGLIYLIKTVRTLTKQMASKEPEKTPDQKNCDYSMPPPEEFMIMRIPPSEYRAVPEVLELEKQLDAINDRLIYPSKRLPNEERKALEDQYDSLIHQMVNHFCEESEKAIRSESLSGV